MKAPRTNEPLIKQFVRFYQEPDPYQTRRRFYERRRLDNAYRMLLAMKPFRHAIDIGCGEGEFTAMLPAIADSVVGVDFVPTAIERARARYGRQGDI